MKTHSTNYQDTFIEVADDSTISRAEIPPQKGDKKTIANRQFELLKNKPYTYTSDDIIFQVYADKKDLLPSEYPEERALFFAKGKPCFRTSPLTKRYGFGVHSNAQGQIAIYGIETAEYAHFMADKDVKKVKAMRSKRR